MLVNLVRWVLNTYIGEYLEDLNADQLSVGLLQGRIELENVPLKKTALKKFDIPWRVKAGVIGKLSLTIPLYRLRSDPWGIEINDLYVILEPNPGDSVYDIVFAEESEQRRKQNQLDALLSFHRRQIGQVSEESQTGWFSYGASVVSLIVENIQLTANNVHVRYEDSSTITGESFACGFRIQRLSVQSTDRKWQPYFVQRREGENLYKMLELNGFDLYWNSNCGPFSSDHSDLRANLHPGSVGSVNTVPDMFIVRPLNAHVLMEKNCSKLPLKRKSRFKLQVDVEQLSLDYSEQQLEGLQHLLDEWGRFERARRYRKYRPHKPVTGHAKLWWKFSWYCLREPLKTRRERCTWHYALGRAQNLTKYVKAYMRLLASDNFSKGDEVFMKQIEMEYSFNELHTMRDIGFKKFTAEKLNVATTSRSIIPVPVSDQQQSVVSLPSSAKQVYALTDTSDSKLELPTVSATSEVQPGYLTSWFTSWYYGTNPDGSYNEKGSGDGPEFELIDYGSDNTNGQLELPSNLKEDLQLIESEFESEILDVISETMEDSTYLRRDFMFMCLSISAPKIEIYLNDISEHKVRILNVELNEVNASIDWSPKRHLITSEVDLNSLSCFLSVNIDEPLNVDPLAPTGQGPPFARIFLNKSCLKWRKAEDFISSFEIQLNGVRVEDLLEVFKKTTDTEKDRLLSISGFKSSQPGLGRGNYFSHSCPDISSSIIPEVSTLSSSLPDTCVIPTTLHFGKSHPGTPPPSPSRSRTYSFSECKPAATINVRLVSSNHPEFASIYRKVGCFIDAEIYALDIVVNQQTWVLFLDFFGLSGPSTVDDGSGTTEKDTVSEIQLHIPTVSLLLNKPTDGQQLAKIYATDLTTTVILLNKEIRLRGSLESISADDCSGFANNLYRQRLSVMSPVRNAAAVKFGFVKFKCSDPDLKREYDALLELICSSTVDYVHTQRFIQELLLFVQNFLNLQELLANIKTGQNFFQKYGFRLRLSLEFLLTRVAVPAFSLSDHLIFVEAGKVLAENTFLFESQKVTDEKLRLSCSDAFDSLLDILHVQLENIQIYSATKKECWPNMDPQFTFSDFCLVKENSGLFKNRTSVTLVVERNLDSTEMHSVPELSVYCHTSSCECKVNISDYKLLRSVLDKNIAETVPNSTIPAHASATKSMSVSNRQWLTLRFVLELNDVVLECLNSDKQTGHFRPLGLVDFRKSKIICENYCNGARDLFVTAEEVYLTDARYLDLAMNKRPSVFGAVLGRKPGHVAPSGHLMAEVHYCFPATSSEARLTVVLSNTRIVWLLDWLSAALEFILIEPDFVPVVKERRFVAPVSVGIVTKKPFSEKKFEPGLLVRLNLTDSEIVFLGNPASLSSLSIVLKTTAFISISQAYPGPTISCNLQNAQLLCCCMSCEEESTKLLVDPFGASVEILPILKTKPNASKEAASVLLEVAAQVHRFDKQQSPRGAESSSGTDSGIMLRHESVSRRFKENANLDAAGGLIEVAAQNVAHRLKITFSDVNCEISYRDIVVVKSVLSALLNTFSSSTEPSSSPSNSSISLQCLELKVNALSAVIFDDFDHDVFPLFRLCFTDCECEQVVSSDFVGSGFTDFNLDYYNTKISQWEPFIEPWKFKCNWTYTALQRACSLDVLSLSELDILDFTVSNTVLDLLSGLQQRVHNACEFIAASDLQLNLHKRPCHNPYVLANHTGSKLWVKTERRGSSKRELMEPEWNLVLPGESFSFRCYGREKHGELFPNQLTVKVDGWHEVNPVCFDKVGVFFRIAKIQIPTNVSSLRPVLVTSTRVVFDIQLLSDNRKLIKVRSAVMLVNALPYPMDLRLENLATFVGDFMDITVPAHSCAASPLRYVSSRILARPRLDNNDSQVAFCSKPISYDHVTEAGRFTNFTRECAAASSRQILYRFCVCVKREHYPEVCDHSSSCHSIAFMPAFTILNLLPSDLNVEAVGHRREIVSPGQKKFIDTVNVSEELKIHFSIETTFHAVRPFVIPAGFAEHEFSSTIEMRDVQNRILALNLRLCTIKGGAWKIIVSVPFWFVNNASLPIVLRQAFQGTEEAAGQFEEHEKARMMSPLPFSFFDAVGSLYCELRIGKGRHGPAYHSMWSKDFRLEPGITKRPLLVHAPNNAPSHEYHVGIEVRPCSGVYASTSLVIISPCYMLDNRLSYRLHVQQKCLTSENVTASSPALIVAAMSQVAWHWPKPSFDRFLCVKQDTLPHWSEGFLIDQMRSFHIVIRDQSGAPHFIRVEILLHGATYHVTFFDASSIPPPMRIYNQSDVPVLYQQRGCEQSHLKAILRPKTAVDYAWDDYMKPPELMLTVHGGKPNYYDMRNHGIAEPLVYENHFYIAFAVTFKPDIVHQEQEESELVFDVMEKGKLITAKRDPTKATQLWRMTKSGMLVNIGFSSQHLYKSQDSSLSTPSTSANKDELVLDVFSHADMSRHEPLMLRPADSRRQSTQYWTFTEDGRLQCRLESLFVQVADCQIRRGAALVLGPAHRNSKDRQPAPLEQWIERRKTKPGSGCLAVSIEQEGPTRALRIKDKAAGRDERRDRPLSQNHFELSLSFRLTGIGMSLINERTEEIIYCRFTDVFLNYSQKLTSHRLRLQVSQVQADNQICGADSWQLLHIKSKYSEQQNKSPAVVIIIQWCPTVGCDIFEKFCVEIGKTSLRIDEVLLWKLVSFMQSRKSSLVKVDDRPNFDLQRVDPSVARRCYFGEMVLSCRKLYLSVITASVLTAEQKQLKQAFNVPLVRFENAPVEIAPYKQQHYMESVDFLFDSLQKHLTEQFKSQAVKILGTVDFLGNPLGLFNDVTEGFSELLTEGSVAGFVAGVTHGFSSSAAKFTNVLSEGVGKIAMDEKHQVLRESMRQSSSSNALGHLVGGVKGLGIGILGGTTSLIQQSYDGAAKDGVTGLMSGLIKGAVGTFAKPVQGVLDLATGIASATKEVVAVAGPHKTRFPPNRLRLPRLTVSFSGAVTVFDESLAAAQKTLLNINDRSSAEVCLSIEPLTATPGDTRFALIATENLYIIQQGNEETVVKQKFYYGNLIASSVVAAQQSLGVELHTRFKNKVDKKIVRCQSVDVAQRLSEKITYAKLRFDDSKRCLAVEEDLSTNL